MPERIGGRGKCLGERFYRSVKSLFLKHIHESKIHVDVIIKTGNMIIVPLDAVIRPDDGNVVVYDGAVDEFRRSAIGTTDGLSGPATLDLVHELFLGHGHLPGCLFHFLRTVASYGNGGGNHKDW